MISKEIMDLALKHAPPGTPILDFYECPADLTDYELCITCTTIDIAFRYKGRLHREFGPAVIGLDRCYNYFIDGTWYYKKEDYNKLMWDKYKDTEDANLCMAYMLGNDND